MVTSSLSTITEHEMKTYGDGKYISAHSLYLHFLQVSGKGPFQAAAKLRERAGCAVEDQKSLAFGRNPKRITVRPVHSPVNVLNELS